MFFFGAKQRLLNAIFFRFVYIGCNAQTPTLPSSFLLSSALLLRYPSVKASKNRQEGSRKGGSGSGQDPHWGLSATNFYVDIL